MVTFYDNHANIQNVKMMKMINMGRKLHDLYVLENNKDNKFSNERDKSEFGVISKITYVNTVSIDV